MAPVNLSPKRWAVLVSGQGSNLRRLLAEERRGHLEPAQIVAVAADRPCPAVGFAARCGVPSAWWPHGGRSQSWEAAFLAWLRPFDVEGLILAGFLRRLGKPVLGAFPGRILNLHPALLPAFPGLEGPKKALEAGVRVTGVTVHFVDEGLDSGPILLQVPVSVKPSDDLPALTARLHRAEHRLLPRAVVAVASGEAALDDGKVKWRDGCTRGRLKK